MYPGRKPLLYSIWGAQKQLSWGPATGPYQLLAGALISAMQGVGDHQSLFLVAPLQPLTPWPSTEPGLTRRWLVTTGQAAQGQACKYK